MGTILLVIHLLVAIFLVAVILLQRSEGGALDGLGGGSGAGSFMTARGTGNFLTRTTAILATIFIITSISLSIYYKGHGVTHKSLVDSIEQAPVSAGTEAPVPGIPDAPVAGK